jgi:CheY-like chemotaxis protein/anti-sigma regulatory factor (Ser/Thr protein kinase)
MTTILVVDDSRLERHRARLLLEKRPGLVGRSVPTGWSITEAGHGREALQAMDKALPDLVVADLQMPEMDGLELVEKIRVSFPSVPVILMTAHGSEEIAVQALRRGAAGYVPKRLLARDLVETVENTLDLTHAARAQQRVLESLTSSEAHFLLENDVALISPLVGYLQNNLAGIRLCDEVGLFRVTVALREALVNAIEHGNLEVPSALREEDERIFRELAELRRHQSPYQDRRVYVTVRETLREAVFVIRDEGPGFNVADLPDPRDPANLERLSGRGLLLIRSFMDEVRFNGPGNEITLIKRRDG